jgi:hypothetical protein
MGMQHRLGILIASVIAPIAFAASSVDAAVIGFEPPTYTSGPLHAQGGWAVSGGTVEGQAASRIGTASQIADDLTAAGLTPGTTVKSGSQALVHSGPGGGVNAILVFSEFNLQPRVVVELSARPLNAGSGDGSIGTLINNTLIMLESAAGTTGRAAGIRFGFVNNVRTIDYWTNRGAGSLWESSALTWDGDTWFDVRFDVDYVSKTYDFYIDNVKLNAESIPFAAPTTTDFHQLRIQRGTNQAGMIVDDISVAIPEPTALAGLLLLGGGLMLRRRK